MEIYHYKRFQLIESAPKPCDQPLQHLNAATLALYQDQHNANDMNGYQECQPNPFSELGLSSIGNYPVAPVSPE